MKNSPVFIFMQKKLIKLVHWDIFYRGPNYKLLNDSTILSMDLRTLSENPATFLRVIPKANYQLTRLHPAVWL